MSNELFLKVNKKRGRELDECGHEIIELCYEGRGLCYSNFDLLELVFRRLEKKIPVSTVINGYDGEEYWRDIIIRHIPLKSTKMNINNIFMNIIKFFSSRCDEESLFNNVYNLKDAIKKPIDGIIDNLDELFYRPYTLLVHKDAEYAIYVLKNLKTMLLKMRKELAWLCVKNV